MRLRRENLIIQHLATFSLAIPSELVIHESCASLTVRLSIRSRPVDDTGFLVFEIGCRLLCKNYLRFMRTSSESTCGS